MKIKISLFLVLLFIFSVFLIKPISVSAEYEYDWGYMWWMSNNRNTYENSGQKWTDAPKYPTLRYGHWSESISWDGWEAYDIKWSSDVTDYYTNSKYQGAPPQRPWLEYYASPAPAGTHYVSPGTFEGNNELYQQGPWISEDNIKNKYRKVAIVYYKKWIPNPTGINLTATYVNQAGEYYKGDSTVDVGVNVKNFSNPSAAYSNVDIKITFNGKDYNTKVSIPTPGDAPSGTNFIFILDAPENIGDYNVFINVNPNDNPHETFPTVTTAHNDNIVNGVIHMKDIPPPVPVGGKIELEPNVQIAGIDSGNRIKAGYGFGLKLNGSNNFGDVKAKSFYYQGTYDGYIKVVYANINSIDNFGIQSSDASKLKFIIGTENNQHKTMAAMLLPSHRGILNWDFESKNKPVTVYENNQVLTFNLDMNTYGASGDKPLLYLPPDTADGNYSLNIGVGSAGVTYWMEYQYQVWVDTSYVDEKGNVVSDGYLDTRYSHWWDGPNTISIKTISLPIVVKGSMFEDDTSVVN